METTVETLQIGTILMGLLGGLAIFLFGMDQMTQALRQTTGVRLKSLLGRATNNRFRAVLTGAFMTAVIQSSSVTTVLVVGFITAGLMTLSQSIGVIMGAEIGTTVTAQIIAFKVTQYALLLVTAGFAVQALARRRQVKRYGTMVMGLGLIFFGMQLMSDSTAPLRDYPLFIDLMQQITEPVFAVLLGAAFTALIQSSSATIGIVIVLASQGLLTLESGIALAFGANIGTSITAVLAAMGKPREAGQAALVHVLFNTFGVLLWFSFIPEFAGFVRTLSPTEVPRQVANAHTIFNLGNMLLFIWFVRPLAWLVHRLIPTTAENGAELLQPKYLDPYLLQDPDLALDRVQMELLRLGRHTLEMVRKSLPAVFHGTEDDLVELARLDDDADNLHIGIVDYLRKLSQENLAEAQSERLHSYMAIANHIENIGDMIQTNLVDSGYARLRAGMQMSEPTQQVLAALHDRVCWAIGRALEGLADSDENVAREVRAIKPEIQALARTAETHLADRLIAEEPNRLSAFRIESDMVEYLKRIYYFTKHIRSFAPGT